jgi:D-alanine-D-alanine ligase
MKQKTIALVFGGRSSEHEVSILSAKNIFAAMDQELWSPLLLGISKDGSWYQLSAEQLSSVSVLDSKATATLQPVTLITQGGRCLLWDLDSNAKTEVHGVFPIIHGTNGEDGSLQGYLKILNVAFVGCGVLSSSLCMDKEFAKLVLTQAGIANSKFRVLRRGAATTFTEISKELGVPFFIKPANAGSSVGVFKIKSEDDFKKRLPESLLYDHKVIAEEFVQGKEIECSVRGPSTRPQAGVPGELRITHEFYSYEAKYIDANGAEISIPARLPSEVLKNIQDIAIKTYQALACDGMARVDFFLRENGKLLVNEVNTLPGFTNISMYPMMWKAAGLGYSELISDLIQQAFDKFNHDAQLKLNF